MRQATVLFNSIFIYTVTMEHDNLPRKAFQNIMNKLRYISKSQNQIINEEKWFSFSVYIYMLSSKKWKSFFLKILHTRNNILYQGFNYPWFSFFFFGIFLPFFSFSHPRYKSYIGFVSLFISFQSKENFILLVFFPIILFCSLHSIHIYSALNRKKQESEFRPRKKVSKSVRM